MDKYADDSIKRLSPSMFSLDPNSKLDATVSQVFQDVFRPMKELIPVPYFLDRLASGIFYRIPQLMGLGRDLSKMNALELGCGRGLKSVPWSTLFRRYWGIDLEAGAIEFGISAAKAAGRQNVEFVLANVADVLRQPRNYGIDEKVDCIIMYAVLEHLTLLERKSVLSAIMELLEPNGILIVAETPNRLIPHDGHSTYLHFFQSLPPELAREYIKRSPRQDARDVAHSPGGLESLYRFGMGASFHEFELFMTKEMQKMPAIINDGWSFWQTFDEPFRRDEIELSNYFSVHGALAQPAFARFWIEAVFDFSRDAQPLEFPKLFQPTIEPGVEVRARPECWTTDLYITDHSGRLDIDCLGSGVSVLQFDIAESAGAFGIFDDKDRQIAEYDIARLATSRLERWHTRCAISLEQHSELCNISLRPVGNGSRLAVEGILGRISEPGIRAAS